MVPRRSARRVPEYRAEGMECRNYLTWPGRQLLLFRRLFLFVFVCVFGVCSLGEERWKADVDSDSMQVGA